MNRSEYLLTCLMEEAAEVQQACAKALRFGLEDNAPMSLESNADKIANEYVDMIAIIYMLVDEDVVEGFVDKEILKRIDVKKNKVKKWMKYSKQKGMLQNDK